MINRVYLVIDEDEELGPLDLIPYPSAPAPELEVLTPADIWLPGEDISQPAPMPEPEPAPAPEPEFDPEPVTVSESDRARAWFASLPWDTMAIEAVHTAEFWHYSVSVYRSEKMGYYLHTRSPQQKQHRYSFSMPLARGDRENLAAGLERFIHEREAKANAATARRDAKRQARAAFVNPYKVGDFLYSHWGYDQTNTEMYQILEVRDVSLKIRRVCISTTATGWDSGTATPCRDDFREEPRWVTLQIGADGSHSVPSPIYGNLYHYDGQPVYFSSGH